MAISQPDPWGFDEPAAETWADILAPQYLDLALLTVFFVLALISFKRKSVPLKFVTFALAIVFSIAPAVFQRSAVTRFSRS